jgi:hypothetical protein
MVYTCRGGLDPPQPSAADYFVPRHWHFGMAAEYIRVKNLLGNSLLARIDYFGRG